jgi:dolichol-phosphate mannosyltransferase
MSESRSTLVARFIRFGIVGGSGVFVNLGIYGLLTRLLTWGATLWGRYASYALSVEISIITNFLLNDVWTFADRRGRSGAWARFLKFHVVSLVGAVVNWGVFAALNWLMDAGKLSLVGDVTVALPWGGWSWTGNVDDFIAACIGIVAAMTWNFFANLWWTWKK